MTLHENRGTTWIDIKNATGDADLGKMYLMKDGNIVESMQLSPRTDGSRTAIYNSDITKMDYIVSLDTINYTMLLIINPFK